MLENKDQELLQTQKDLYHMKNTTVNQDVVDGLNKTIE